MSALSPFDYLKSINETKKDIMVDDIAEKQYTPFIVNRGLSLFVDTVMYANEMNKVSHLDHRLQYDFYMLTVKKKKRWSKWPKKLNHKDTDMVKEYYGYSTSKAEQIMPLLNKTVIKNMREELNKGGRNKNNSI